MIDTSAYLLVELMGDTKEFAPNNENPSKFSSYSGKKIFRVIKEENGIYDEIVKYDKSIDKSILTNLESEIGKYLVYVGLDKFNNKHWYKLKLTKYVDETFVTVNYEGILSDEEKNIMDSKFPGYFEEIKIG